MFSKADTKRGQDTSKVSPLPQQSSQIQVASLTDIPKQPLDLINSSSNASDENPNQAGFFQAIDAATGHRMNNFLQRDSFNQIDEAAPDPNLIDLGVVQAPAQDVIEEVEKKVEEVKDVESPGEDKIASDENENREDNAESDQEDNEEESEEDEDDEEDGEPDEPSSPQQGDYFSNPEDEDDKGLLLDTSMIGNPTKRKRMGKEGEEEVVAEEEIFKLDDDSSPKNEKDILLVKKNQMIEMVEKRKKAKVKPKKKKSRRDIETENLKNKLKEDELEVRKAIQQRKRMRFFAYVTYLIIIAIVAVVALTTLIEKRNIYASSGASFDITLENCTLLITDHTDSSISNEVYLKYHVPRDLQVNKGSEIITSSNGNIQTLLIKNGFSPRYCLVELFVKSSAQLGSLKIACPGCNITQDNSFQLQVTGALDISGTTINANFRNIKVGSISYQADSGYLQLSNIDTASAANTLTMNYEGDIIIQSTSNFYLDATVPNQTFCFNAPGVYIATPLTGYNCAISGESSTDTLKGNSGCRIKASLCTSSSCSTVSSPAYTVIANVSNVYANIIPSVGTPTASGTTQKGQIYDDGLGFSTTAEAAVTGFDTLVDDDSKGNPFTLLEIGNFGSRSSRSTKWVISSTPSYSYMRPWWIGTMSGTVLNGYTERVKGFMFPGTCPFVPQYTTEDLLNIQTLMASKINYESTLITFVNDITMSYPQATPQASTGVFYYAPRGNPFDKWLSLSRLENGNVVLQNNDYTSKGEILAAIILSLLIAAYVSITVIQVTIIAINMMYHKLVNFANHMESYTKLEQPKEVQKAREESHKDSNKNKKKVVQTKHTLFNILKNSPSPSAFIDYLSLILYRQFSSSVAQFYFLLFREVKTLPGADPELDPAYDMIKGFDAKIFYEKFCFMNHLNEEKLTDRPNLSILKQYGFTITTREDLVSEVFTRVNIKNYDNFLIRPPNESDNLDSLQIYVKENAEITEFQEDQIEVDTFIRIYYSFCDYNRLPRVTLSPSIMKEKFGINSSVVPQQFIMRKEDTGAEEGEGEEEGSKDTTNALFRALQKCKDRIRPPAKKVYNLDTSKLDNHFNLIMNTTQDMTPKQLSSATRELILYPRWWLWDWITVLFHLFVGAVVTLPLLGLVILNESQYEPWSLKEPAKLILIEDLIRDPRDLIFNLYHSFTWNIIIMIIVSILWVLGFIDLLLYYSVMEFPQDKSFKKSEEKGETFWQKVSRILEWILVLFALACYFGYIGLFLTWLLLGAFINPNAFLPFASGAVTFVTFVSTKYKAFKDLSAKGTKAVMDYLKEIFGGFINKLMGKLTQNLDKAADSLTDKGKALLESDTFKAATGKLAETGIVDAATIAEYTRKIKQIDGKVALSGAIAVMDDPSVVLKEINNLALALKDKAIEKVKEECSKRGIPSSLVDFVIAVSLKDSKKMKETLKQVIVEGNQQVGMPEASIEVIIEMLFPQSLNKDEMVMFITSKIVQLIFDIFHLNDIQGLTPEILINAFNNFKNLQDLEIGPFVKGLKGLLADVEKTCNIKEIDFFLPTLDIIQVIGQKGGDYWRLKGPALNLLTNAVKYLSGGNSEKNVKMIQNFVQFLSVVSSSYETPADFTNWKPLENGDVLRVINDLFSSLGIDTLCERAGIQFFNNKVKFDKNFAGNLVYLVIAFTKQETHDLPKELIRDLEKVLTVSDFGSNEVLSFVFNLANVIFNTPTEFHHRLQKNISNFALEDDLQNFLKIVTCYSLADFKTQYSSISVENNKYFVDLAGTLKIHPTELLGLIDVIYNKSNSQNIDTFLTAILKRMNLKSDKIETLKPLVNLFLSEDEAALLEAVKTLDLKYGQFLLIGKSVLNPRFIPKSQFIELGITDDDLLKEKDTIFNSSPENYEYWKGQLRTQIQNYINTQEAGINNVVPVIVSTDKNKDTTSQEEERKTVEQDYETRCAAANLVKLYLTDWTTYSFSKKNVTSLIAVLNNPTNKLKEKLTKAEKGSTYNGLDFLTTALNVKELEMNKNKRYARLDKEKETAISVLSEYLSVNPDTLKNCLQIFVIDDPNVVLKSFFDFFPSDKAYHEELQRILAYTFKQSSIIQNQTEFITNKLPSCIEFLGDKNMSLPRGLFKKIFFGPAEGKMNISEVLEFAYMVIRKLIPDSKIQQGLLEICYKVGLFAKGLLSKEDIAMSLNVQDEKILKLFDILMQPDMKARLTIMTELFKEDDHIKKAIAIFGLFTRQSFKIRHPTGEAGKYKEESIKQYLASQFNVYPEVFELFDIAFERNISNFIQKALPLVRRVNEVSFVDINLLESLFALSLGERFNTGYLANRLEMSSDVIDFFVTITRLTNESTREKELKALPNSIPTQKVLTKLKVKSQELVALTKLIFNMFVADDTSINEILAGLGLKKQSIDVGLFKGLVSVNAYIDPSKNMFINRKELALKRSEISSFFNTLGLSSTSDSALIISRIVAGDYLALREFRQQLDWAFPNDGSRADVAIRNLTMGLCGIINPVIGVPAKLNEEVDSFINTFYQKEKDFKEAEYKEQGKSKNQVLPNNSIAYAIYLTYQTLDIDPVWTQAFLLNQEIFYKIKSKLPDLRREFVLTVILNFISLPDYTRDYLGLYEWVKHCTEYANQDPKEHVKPFEGDTFKLLTTKISFDYEKTIEKANKLGLFQDETWRKFIGKVDTYNTRVNQTFLYLLTLSETDVNTKKSYLTELSKDLSLPPAKFLPELARVLNKESSSVEDMILSAVVKSYTTIADKFNPDGQRLKGYELTNFSILGTIISLRNGSKTNMTYNRTLYNLHQLAMNIERKLFLEDCFFKMSKIKTMKFTGIALGMQINNIVEWCLPPSLFSLDYVMQLSKANSTETLKDNRIAQIIKILAKDGLTQVGDLGAIGGTLTKYKEYNSSLLSIDDWNFFELWPEYTSYYLGDPQADNMKNPESLPEIDRAIFEEGETKNKKVFISREIVSLLYIGIYTGEPLPPKKVPEEEDQAEIKQNANMSEEWMKQRKEQRASKEDSLRMQIKQKSVDFKTGLAYQSLERKSEEFEEILTNSNMELLQGIIKGDTSILLKGEHLINKGDEEKNKAKLYMALLGLQSFKKSSSQDDRKLFKEYINTLAAYTGSNMAKLEELLTFFITKKPNLNECVSALELQESIVDLLLIKVKEAASASKSIEEEENEDEQSDKFSIIKTIQDTLKIDKSDLESFTMIRNIYQFKLKAGWQKLIKKMIKDVPEGSAKYTVTHHPLLSLAKNINFKRMLREIDSLEVTDILKFLKVDEKYKGDVFSMLFEEIIMMDKVPTSVDPTKLQLQKEQEEKNRKQKEFLVKAHNVIQSIINQDFQQLFGMLLLTNGEKIDFKTLNKKSDVGSKKDLPEENKENIQVKPSSESQEEFLIEILDLFGVQTKIPSVKESIKLLKVFLTMASSNMTIFKDKENYKDVITKIINDISDTKLISFTGLNLKADTERKIQKQIGELLLGVLGWDIERVINSFITEETLEIAYLLYHIYGCLKLNKVLSLGADGVKEAQRHIQVLLSVVGRAIISTAEWMTESLIDYYSLMEEDFGYGGKEEILVDLKSKVDQLLANTSPTAHTQEAKSILELATEAFKNDNQDPLRSKENSEFILDLATSICDGSILIKLLNTLIKDGELKAFIKSMIGFILQIVEKFFSPTGKNKNYEDIINSFNVSAQALKNLLQQNANPSLNILLDNVPNVMKIYLTLESGGIKDTAALEVQVLGIIKDIISKAASSERQELLFNLLSIVVGINMNKFDEKTAGNKLKFDVGIGERMTIFFTKIMPAIFPGLDTYFAEEDFKMIYDLIIKLKTDFVFNYKDPQKQREIVIEVAKIIQNFYGCDAEIVKAIVAFLEGNFKDTKYLVRKVVPPEISDDNVDKMLKYICEVKNVLNIDFSSKLALPSSKDNSKNKETKKMDPEVWATMLKKIKEEKASSKDLFKLVDEEGDKSGTISEKEFATLAGRLGLKLSNHRIKEIFAKVKGNKAKGGVENELNEKEFELALNYLEGKNLNQALQLLGITPEILTAILIRLIILLILIFAFIFIGIKAFAIGGTFGAIINSAFPAAGGLGLGKESSSEKEKLNNENIKQASDTGMEITASEQI